MALESILNFGNPLFTGYLTYSTILVLKMMFMVPLTGLQRFKHLTFTSPEDHAFLGKKNRSYRHEDVERVRKAHRNDMENILIYFVASFIYILTDPDPTTALKLFRIFTISRCMHTFVYAMWVIPQPARVISWFIGYAITGYMSYRALVHFATF